MRLEFASTKDRLFGRAKELEILGDVYQRIQHAAQQATMMSGQSSSTIFHKGNDDNNENNADENLQEDIDGSCPGEFSAGPHLVLLGGMSGNGKTSLVHHFGASCELDADSESMHENGNNNGNDRPLSKRRHKRCCYIKGKFDEQHQKPYAAFVEAFEDLLSHILKHEALETERLSAIREALQGDDALVEVLPSLSEILWPEHDDNNVGEMATDDIPGFSNNPSGAIAWNKHRVATKQIKRRRSRGAAQALTEEGVIPDQTIKERVEGPVVEGTMLEQRHQFHYRFQAFVRAVTKDQPQPLVLFLDDMQWSDSASLELFQALLGDASSTNLMVIGAFRGQEVEDDDHPFRVSINRLENHMYEQSRYWELNLKDFELPDLNEFVAASLDLAPEKTMSLSQVIHRKTHGNIFFSREFLKNLEVQKLLRYDMNFYQWTWDVAEISGSTNISDNVVDLIANRIRQLPESAVWILKVCSCLWFSFDVAVLELVVAQTREELNNPRRLGHKLLATTLGESLDNTINLKIDVTTQSDVIQGLFLATEQGLLDQMQTTAFKFAHDKIREATYGLIKEGEERDRMHFVIGEALFRMYHSEKSQQWMLFSSVDQLNKISSHVDSKSLRLRLAEVNLEAADCATSVSAYLPAIIYLKAGIKLLGEGRWQQEYRLSLNLYSKLAALEASVGRTEEASMVIEEIIKQGRTFEDKVPAFTTKIESLSVQGKLKESLDIAFKVLEDLGEHFPLHLKGRAFEKRVAEDKARTARLLRNHTEATILNLPLLKDEKKQCTLRILNLMVDPSFHTGQMSKLYLVINRMVRISINSGLGRSSGVAFALYGFSLSSDDGNRKENYRYGKLAEILQEKLSATEFDCRVLTFVYVLLNHWQEPLQKSLSPLLSAHRVGMEKGDIDYAFQAAGSYLTLYWYSGHDLKVGVNESKRFTRQMLDYEQQKALTIYRPLFRCMSAMAGNLENALKAMRDMELEQEKIEFANSTLMSYQMQLAYYFGDMKQAGQLSTKLQAVSKSFNAHYLFVSRLFFFGMIALRVALETAGKRRRRQLLGCAKDVIKEMEQWTRHGGLNCLHKLLILKAELQGFELSFPTQRWWARTCKDQVDFDSARSAFDTAIAISTRTGFRNDAALASERASAFFQRCGNTFLADSYQSRSAKYYMEWGAIAKVEQLTSLDSESMAFDTSNGPMTGTTTRGMQPRLPEIDHGKLGMSHLSLSGARRDSMFFSDSQIISDPSLSMLGESASTETKEAA